MQSTYFSIWKDLLHMNRYSTGRYTAIVSIEMLGYTLNVQSINFFFRTTTYIFQPRATLVHSFNIQVHSIFIQCTSLTFLHRVVHLSLFNNLYFIYINLTIFQPGSWTQPWGQGMYFVLVCISELRQLDGRGKTMANLICVTSMTIILFEKSFHKLHISFKHIYLQKSKKHQC